MAYETEGTLTTESKTVEDAKTWETQSDWDAETKTGIDVDGSLFGLLESLPDPVGDPYIWYPMDEGSGSTITDNVGAEDGTINGPDWLSNDAWIGDHALEAFASENDYVELTTLGDFGSQMNACAVAFTVRTTQTGSVHNLMGAYGGATGTGDMFRIELNRDAAFNSDDEAITIDVRDENTNRYRFGGGNVNDGTKKRVVFNINDANAGNGELRVNDTQQTITEHNETPSSFTNLNYPVDLFVLNEESSRSTYTDAVLNDLIFYTSPLTSTEISDDYNRMP